MVRLLLLFALTASALSQEPFQVVNLTKKDYKFNREEANRIYFSSTEIVRREYKIAARPHFTLYLGAKEPRYESRIVKGALVIEVHLAGWQANDRLAFAFAVIKLAYTMGMTEDQAVSLAVEAKRWADSTVSADELRERK